MKYEFKPNGICATKIRFELNGDVISNVYFNGGCDGNHKAIARLLEGATVDFAEQRLLGNTCGFKNTSCADQLAKGLRLAKDGKLEGIE